MNDLFDNVIYAGIDTDKHKYPIGKHGIYISTWHLLVQSHWWKHQNIVWNLFKVLHPDVNKFFWKIKAILKKDIYCKKRHILQKNWFKVVSLLSVLKSIAMESLTCHHLLVQSQQ